MVAYDPDERVTAHQALQHPYFQEQRAAEKQALARARWKAPAPFPECPTALELSSTWQTAQEGRKQKQPPRPEENHPQRPGPAYLMELPRLKLSGGAKLASYSSPALPSVFLPKVPLLRPLKCVGAAQKTRRRTSSPA